MRFIDREDAGRQLAVRLENYAGRPATIVLGIPRGGVVVAYQVARALHLPLDVFLSRKLGVPGHEELAFGAIAAGDGTYLDAGIVRAMQLSSEQIERMARQAQTALEGRAEIYRCGRRPLLIEGQTVVLIDDGIATGASIFAAVRAIRQKVAKLVIAVPVAPRSICAALQMEVDELIAITSPADFYAVGQFYAKFSATSDQEVAALLAGNAAEIQAASIPL